MTSISLPGYAYESHLPDLFSRLSRGDGVDEVELDFLPVNFWTPGALVSLLAKVHFWLGKNKRVVFRNCKESPAFRYLQRINFFSNCGLQLGEDFHRHEAGSRFVELRCIGGTGAADVAELSTDIAYCISPDADLDDPEQSGLFDLIEYSVSELAGNVMQHAKAPGFAMAQYTPRTDLVRIGIADYGIGILGSFAENGSPLWKPEWSDADAIEVALQAKVSSKLHLRSPWGDPVNAGVGLTLLKELSAQTGGHFLLASGNGEFSQGLGAESSRAKTLGTHFHGTICVLAFGRANIRNFPQLMHQVKSSVGLLPGSDKFDNLFT